MTIKTPSTYGSAGSTYPVGGVYTGGPTVYTVTEQFIRGAEKALESCDTHPDDMEANLSAVIGDEILRQREERATSEQVLIR